MEKLRVPLVNANEDEVTIVEFLVEEGDRVRKGELLFTVESTKATLDVEAPMEGYVRQIFGASDQRVKVGSLIMILTPGATDKYELDEKVRVHTEGEGRFTKKAGRLAEMVGLSAADMGLKGIIKEKDVQAYLKSQEVEVGIQSESLDEEATQARVDTLLAKSGAHEKVVVYGAGGHAHVLIDMIRQGYPNVEIVGIIDDHRVPGEIVFGLPVLGPKKLLDYVREAGVRYAVLGVGAVTNNRLRIELFNELKKAGYELPNLIHPKAIVEPSVVMGEGNQIFGGAVVSSGTRLGTNTIINSNAVVSHDCEIGDHSHLTPSAILAGGVKVGMNTVIGMAATIYLGVRIGDSVMVANGVNVMADVGDNQLLKA